MCSKGEVVEVVDRKAGWRAFSSMKRQSLQADIQSKLRSITVKAGARLVLTCPTYVYLLPLLLLLHATARSQRRSQEFHLG